jgi:hypothetical protein
MVRYESELILDEGYKPLGDDQEEFFSRYYHFNDNMDEFHDK